MKKYQTINRHRQSFWLNVSLWLTLAFTLFPKVSYAQKYPYPLNSRTIFLSGCLLENPPNFNNDAEVINKMRMCLCLLDKFQDHYTNQAFMTLFTNAERSPQAKQELDSFVNQHIRDCF